MSDYTFKHGTEGQFPEPGQWVKVDMDYPDRAKHLKLSGVKALCCCPNGHQGSLVNHTIDDDGEVHASYLCHRADCGFHVFARLDNWIP